MPAVTSMKGSLAGTKRKSVPPHSVGNKKPKIESRRPVMRTAHIASESSDGSDDSETEGGVQLNELGDSEEGEPETFNQLPNVSNGVHLDRAKGVTNSQSSKEAHAKQKQLAQERKAAKPLADELARSKKLWERLRRKSHVPLEERRKLISELFEIITGRCKDFVLKHDSVRVIQTAIKYANKEQREMIARELSGSYRQLAESRYAKFLIGKLLVHGDTEIRDIIVPEFFGHVRRLIKHPEASWILDDIYRGVASKQQKSIMLREWYGAEFALFKKDNNEPVSGELANILAADPGKRAPIMRSLQELINHLVQKKMTGFTLLHDAMLQYLLNTKPGTEEVSDYIELIKGDEEGDLLKNLAFTRSGSRLVSLILAYGTAKDRKHILKAFKETLQMMAADTNAHIVILAAFETIDDTVLTAKSIFPELLGKDADKQVENIVFSANDLNARLPLLYLFQGRSRALFPPSHSVDLEILAEVDIARKTTSKKDPEIRRAELIKALSPYLLKAISTAASELVATSFGPPFIAEVLFGAEGAKNDALGAIAEIAAGDPLEAQSHTNEGVEGVRHVGATPAGGKMLKALISGGRFDPALKKVVPVVPALNFSNVLYPFIKDFALQWAIGESSFVILALLESEDFTEKTELKNMLKRNKKDLQKAATEETAEQKAKRDAQVSSEQKPAKDKKGKPGKDRIVGNRGSALILEKL